MGDFVKGKLETLAGQFPERVLAGIRLHRQIDQFTDAHPHWRASRARFSAPMRRFAGVTVDMVYDHFLARDWHHYDKRPLASFTEHAYRQIAQYEAFFPVRLQRMFPYLSGDDWLASYAQFDNVAAAIARMSTRSARLAPLADTVAEARECYDELSADFAKFFPKLVDFAFQEPQNTQSGAKT